MTANLKRFGEIVKARREDLGLRQDQLVERRGPSTTTMTKVENGNPPPPSAVTLRKLDTSLGWEPGSAQKTLDGGNPTPRSPDAGETPRKFRLPTSSFVGDIPAEQFEELSDLVRRGQEDPQARREAERLYQDLRIAELPELYPLLSRVSRLKVANLGKRLFDEEYANARISDLDTAAAAGASGTQQSKKTQDGASPSLHQAEPGQSLHDFLASDDPVEDDIRRREQDG